MESSINGVSSGSIKLKAIWARNFQSHTKSKIILSDGMTGLLGTNDVGKSALGIKVLTLIRFNRPVGAGTRYIQDGKKEALIGVQFDNGVKVSMHMYTNKPNKYVVKYPDGSKHVADVVGTSVPKEVVEAFGNFGEINLQTQRETAFFILDPAGKIAQLINETKGIGKVDQIISKLKSKIRGVDEEYERATGGVDEVTEQLKERRFLELEKFQKYYNQKLKVSDDMRKLRKNNEVIVEIIRKLVDSTSQISELSSRVISKDKLIFVRTAFDEIDSISNDNYKLAEIILDYERQELAESSLFIITNKERVDIDKFESVKASVKELFELINDYEELVEEEPEVQQAIERAAAELEEVFSEFDICPFCGSTMENNECMHR